MDIAIRLEVEDSPLSLARQPKVSVPLFTKNILRIDSYSAEPDHEYIQESIHFTSCHLQEAEASLLQEAQKQDAILIHPSNLNGSIQSLKNLAQEKAIPLILYTPNFEEATKELAFKLGVDEYHYGSITYAFLKRIEFIKKLKN